MMTIVLQLIIESVKKLQNSYSYVVVFTIRIHPMIKFSHYQQSVKYDNLCYVQSIITAFCKIDTINIFTLDA